jgi:hypothetical protein
MKVSKTIAVNGHGETYLVDSKGLIVINDSNLDGVGEIRIVAFLDINNIIDWQADLDTVAVVA